MTIRKVRKGQSLDISARDWNKIADSVNVFGNQSTRQPAGLSPDCIWIKNTLSRDLERYAAVCIGSPILVEPMTGKNDPVFGLRNGSLQGQQAYGQADPIIGILQEPIANNRIGQAQITGITPASFSLQNDAANTSPAEFATMSDDKDMLSFAQFGPIRVLQRNLSTSIGNIGAGKYLMVQLGHPPHIGSCEFNWSKGAITSTPNDTVDFANGLGDFVGVGVHGDSEQASGMPANKAYVSRSGRYEVLVTWTLTLPSETWGTDRVEWRITWDATDLTQSGAVYGGFTPGAWTGVPVISGQRSFYFSLSGAPRQIPIPGMQAVRIPTTGAAASVSPLTASGKILVKRLGSLGASSANSGAWISFWTKAKRDASWARGATAGPI